MRMHGGQMTTDVTIVEVQTLHMILLVLRLFSYLYKSFTTIFQDCSSEIRGVEAIVNCS